MWWKAATVSNAIWPTCGRTTWRFYSLWTEMKWPSYTESLNAFRCSSSPLQMNQSTIQCERELSLAFLRYVVSVLKHRIIHAPLLPLFCSSVDLCFSRPWVKLLHNFRTFRKRVTAPVRYPRTSAKILTTFIAATGKSWISRTEP